MASVYCLIPLVFSVAYLLIYGAALTALLIKNKARFTRQIKIVLVILLLTSCS